MSTRLELHRRGPGIDQLPDTFVSELERAIVGQSTLEHVLGWARSRSPKAQLVDVVIQDEYTHDVIFDLGVNRGDTHAHLVYDTT